MPSARIRTEERGFTIVEVMVALALLLTVALGTISLIDRASATTSEVKAREGATSLAREVVEAARSIPYPELLSTTLEAKLQASPGLGDGSTAPGYQIERRNFTYEVAAEVCTLDDKTDGFGSHAAGGYCAGSTGTSDLVPDDYRRFAVTVTWKPRPGEPNSQQSARQTTLINNPGSSFGVAVTDLRSVRPLPILSDLVSLASLDFEATTSRPAASVRWAVDGVDKGEATKKGGSDTVWEFAWLILSVEDGRYNISARAFDSAGLSAGEKSIEVVLNRSAPKAPTGVLAGRNSSGDVDIEWLANTERDVIGYDVYRMLGVSANPSVDTLVCGTRRETSSPAATNCTDENAPAPGGLIPTVLTYYVVALDRDGNGEPRRSLPSAPAAVPLVNTPPTAVQSLAATTNADGDKQLTWSQPSSAGGLGATIEFYRVYRSDCGSSARSRYRRVGTSTPLSFTDTGQGTGHCYWVSAVNNSLAESPLSGPVQ